MRNQKVNVNYKYRTNTMENNYDPFNYVPINDNNYDDYEQFNQRDRAPSLPKMRKPMIYTFYTNNGPNRNKSKNYSIRNREIIDDNYPSLNRSQVLKNNNNINTNRSMNYTINSTMYTSPSGMNSLGNLTTKYNDGKLKLNKEDDYYKILFHQLKGHNFLLLNKLKEQENFEEKIKDLESKNKKLEDENNELKNNKTEIENANLQLNEKLDKIEKEKETNEQKFLKEKEMIEQKILQEKETNEQNLLKEKEISEQKILKEKEMNEQKILQEKEAAENKIVELENKIKEMNNEIANSEITITELKNKVENNENTITHLNDENKLLKQEAEDLEKIKNESSKKEFRDSKDISLQKEISLQVFNDDEKSKKELKIENELLQAKNEELSKEINTIKEEKAKVVEEEKEQLNSKNNVLNEELSVLKTVKEDQEKKITDLTNQLQQAEDNYQKCIDEMNTIKNNNICLIKENENLKLTQTKNEETISEFQKQQQAFNEYNELKNRNTLLSEENNKLEQKKSLLESHCNGLKELVDLSNDDLKMKVLNLKENNELLLKRLEESDNKKNEFERKLIKLQTTFNEQLEEEKKDFIGLYNKRKRDMENNISFCNEEEDKEIVNSLVDRKSDSMKQQNKMILLKNENRALKEVVNDLKSKIIVMKGNNANNSINSIKNSQNDEIINSLKNENSILAKEKQLINNYLTNSNNEIANLQNIINEKDQLITDLSNQIHEYQNKIKDLENEKKLLKESLEKSNLPNVEEIINHENNNMNNMNGNDNINVNNSQELKQENKINSLISDNENKLSDLNENNFKTIENEELKEPNSQNHSVQQNISEKKSVNESHSRYETASVKHYTVEENNENNNQNNNNNQQQDNNNQENGENDFNFMSDFNVNDLKQPDSQSQNQDIKSNPSLNINNNNENQEVNLENKEVNLENNANGNQENLIENNVNGNQEEVNGGNEPVNEKKSLTENEVLGVEAQNQEVMENPFEEDFVDNFDDFK